MENKPAGTSPRIQIAWAFWIAVAGVAIGLTAALVNPVVGILAAVISGASAFGIARRRAWSAYGFALFAITSIAVGAALALSSSEVPAPFSLALNLVWELSIAFVFFRAGRAIQVTGGKRGNAWPWCTLAALLCLFFVFFGAYILPTGSMGNTLLIGDSVLVRKTAAVLHRGDLVVFHYPIDRKQTFVKRVVAIAGDRIRIRDKQVFVNGVAERAAFIKHATPYIDSFRDNFPSEPNTMVYPQCVNMLKANVVQGEVLVPANRYFVLGDNRDLSLDSRYWGFVAQTDVIGKPVMIYNSVATNSLNINTTSQTSPRLGNIRWNRLLKFVR